MPTWADDLGRGIAQDLFLAMGDPCTIVRGSLRVDSRAVRVYAQREAGQFSDVKLTALQLKIQRKSAGIRPHDLVEYDGRRYRVDQSDQDNGYAVACWVTDLGPFGVVIIPIGSRTVVSGLARSVVDGRTRSVVAA